MSVCERECESVCERECESVWLNSGQYTLTLVEGLVVQIDESGNRFSTSYICLCGIKAVTDLEVCCSLRGTDVTCSAHLTHIYPKPTLLFKRKHRTRLKPSAIKLCCSTGASAAQTSIIILLTGVDTCVRRVLVALGSFARSSPPRVSRRSLHRRH